MLAVGNLGGVVVRVRQADRLVVLITPRPGIKGLIMQIKETASVPGLGSGLHFVAKNAAAGSTIIRAHARAGSLKFLDRLHGRARFTDIAANLRNGGCAID